MLTVVPGALLIPGPVTSMTKAANGRIVSWVRGYCFGFPGGAEYYELKGPALDRLNSVRNYTFAYYTQWGGGVNGQVIAVMSSGIERFRGLHRTGSSNALCHFYKYSGSSEWEFACTVAPLAGGLVTVWIVTLDGDVVKFYRDGLKVSDFTITNQYVAWGTGEKAIRIGNNYGGGIYQVSIWNRAFSHKEAVEYSRNPSCIFDYPEYLPENVVGAAAAPTLTAAIAHNLGSTVVTPRVTFTR